MKNIKNRIEEIFKNKIAIRNIVYALYIILTVFILFGFLQNQYIREFFSVIENKTFDVRQNVVAPYKNASKDIVIITVDEESHEYFLDKYGEWPISRSVYADMVRFLEKQNPSAIAFDLMFVKSMKSSSNADKSLADAISQNDNVFTAINFDELSYDLRQPVDLPEAIKANVVNESNIKFKNTILDFPNCRAIISLILDSTPNIGHINLIRDEDGIARSFHPFVMYKDDFYPHLALKVAVKHLQQKEGVSQKDFKIDQNNNLLIGNRKIPLVGSGAAILNWYGQSGINTDKTFTYVPMWKVEKDMYENTSFFDKDYFKGKIIYIGTSATSLFDIKSVPTEKVFPGVEIHATFINNILDNNFIKRVPPIVDVLISIVLGLFIGFVIIKSKSTIVSSVLTIVSGILYALFATALMLYFNLWIGIVLQLTAVLFVFIACYLAKYIIKSRDLEYTYALATTDGLTELFNHRYFQEQMLRNIETAKRYNKPFSLIMIDIDFFKKFNDTYGHQSGDAVLRQVAYILKKNVRSSDIVCRYGGEEMSIILTNTGYEEALVTAKKICNAVSEHPLKLVNGNDVNVTISLGVSTCPQNGETSADMIKYADDCLYVAKEHGRNQVGNFAKDMESK